MIAFLSACSDSSWGKFATGAAIDFLVCCKGIVATTARTRHGTAAYRIRQYDDFQQALNPIDVDLEPSQSDGDRDFVFAKGFYPLHGEK